MNQGLNRSKKLFPFVWPWTGENGRRMPLRTMLYSRKFTITYLIVIWTVIGILDFASTWDCESTWQLALQCEYAFWIKNLAETPLVFLRNLLTTPFIHNGIDHILFVSVLGFLMIVQSHEVALGTKATAAVFFSSYFTVAPMFAVLYTVAFPMFPESEFLEYVMARNWVGGSIGMFQVYGSLAVLSRRPIVMMSAPVIFEVFNQTVIGIHPQISIMHITCAFVGYAITHWYLRGKLTD